MAKGGKQKTHMVIIKPIKIVLNKLDKEEQREY